MDHRYGTRKIVMSASSTQVPAVKERVVKRKGDIRKPIIHPTG